VKTAIFLAFLLACGDGENQAMKHAWLLSDRAGCLDIGRTPRYGDMAECTVGHETWWCTGTPPACYVRGPRVRILIDTRPPDYILDSNHRMLTPEEFREKIRVGE
jgi:hypothetical protein